MVPASRDWRNSDAFSELLARLVLRRLRGDGVTRPSEAEPPTSLNLALGAFLQIENQVRNASATVRPAVRNPWLRRIMGFVCARSLIQTRAFIQIKGNAPHSRE